MIRALLLLSLALILPACVSSPPGPAARPPAGGDFNPDSGRYEWRGGASASAPTAEPGTSIR